MGVVSAIRVMAVIMVWVAMQLGTAQAQPPACGYWEHAGSNRPAARFEHAMAYDAIRQRVVVFGGSNQSNAALGDTWEWDGSMWTERTPTTSPTPRRRAAMVFDLHRRICVLFGGDAGDSVTWGWDGNVWMPIAMSGPPPRQHHAMAYDEVRREVVMIGGSLFGGGADDQTWVLSNTGWTVRESPSNPSSTFQHCMAFDRSVGRIVMHTGTGPIPLWEWDGATWIPRTFAPPGTPRFGAFAVFDPRRQRVQIAGSFTCSSTAQELWEWDSFLGVWARRLVDLPAPTAFAGIAFDEARNSICLFGGRDPNCSSQRNVYSTTWLLGGGPRLLTQPQSVAAVPTQDVSFTVTTSASTPVTYQWRRNNVPLTDSARITGTTSPTLVIVNVSAADAGEYSVVLTSECGTSMSNPAALTITCTLPTITTHPATHPATYNQTTTFNVVAAGTGTLGYRWRKDGVDLVDSPRLLGTGSATLAILNATDTDAGAYDVVVTNACGAARSNPASLILGTACPADFNRSGQASVQDLFDFLSAYFAGCP